MALDCSSITFSGHAVSRMFERNIRRADVIAAIENGEIIRSYPDDSPYPSYLLLWKESEQVLHIVLARDPQTEACYVVTVYRPSPALWSPDYRNRRQ